MISKKPLLLTHRTAHVRQPVDAVFTFVSNHENYKRWYPGIESVTSADDAPHGAPGKTYLETLQMPGGRLKTISIVTVTSDAPRLFMTEGDFPALMPRMTFELEPSEDGGTRIDWKFHSRHTSPARRLLARLVFRPLLKRQTAQAMASLTSVLEQEDTRSPPAPASR